MNHLLRHQIDMLFQNHDVQSFVLQGWNSASDLAQKVGIPIVGYETTLADEIWFIDKDDNVF